MLQFNGKPYPLAAVLPDFEAHSAYLAYVVELEDQQCEALLLALNALLECAEEDAGRRYGVCSAVESVTPPVLRCLRVRGYEGAWPYAKTSHGFLASYFCEVERYIEPWVGVNYERRMQFMQFCVEALTEFMQDRSRSTCTSM